MLVLRRIKYLFLFLLVTVVMFGNTEVQASSKDVSINSVYLDTGRTTADYGYVDMPHNWATPSACGTCGGDHKISKTVKCSTSGCSTCGGDGVYYVCAVGCGKIVQSSGQTHYCPNTGGTVVGFTKETHYKKSSVDCTKCFSNGTNTKCLNAGCSYNTYGAWSAYYDAASVCYQTPKTVTVYYHFNDGGGEEAWEIASQIFTYGVSNQKFGHDANGNILATGGQFCAWDRYGHLLLGWSQDPNATANTFAIYQDVDGGWINDNAGEVHLYAVWKPYVNVYYHRNDGSGEVVSQTFFYGVANQKFGHDANGNLLATGGQFCAWDRYGHQLLGWSLDENAAWNTFATYQAVEDWWISANAGDIHVYAVWRPYVNVYYHRNDGSEETAIQTFFYGVANQKFGHDTNGNLLATGGQFCAWDRYGHLLLGWSLDENAAWNTFAVYQAVEDWWIRENAGDIHLYAVWNPKSTTVVFHRNYAVSDTDTYMENYIYGSPNQFFGMELERPDGYAFGWWHKTGHTMLGWAHESYATDAVYEVYSGIWDSWIDAQPEVVHLYGVWGRNQYQVIYDANGGSTEAQNAYVYYGDKIDLSPSASKDGYSFVGWNTDKDAFEGLAELTMLDGDVTLYAIYTIPVSDVQRMELHVWQTDNEAATKKIYELTKTSKDGMTYTYDIQNIDVTEIASGNTVEYAIVAYDHAGNYSVIEKSSVDPYIPSYYWQTVEHYFYNVDEKAFDEIPKYSPSEQIKEGLTYTPEYLSTIPQGYRPHSIDPAYVVTGNTVSKAYYMANEYTLYLDANGGQVLPESKRVLFGEKYGALPTPFDREGYKFLGWYSQKEGGERITSDTRHDIPSDRTIYAQWEVNSHDVVYDYWTNGGASMELSSNPQSYSYGAYVDLSIEAVKAGWEHIGWALDANATEPLSTYRMPDKGVTLYAIYKKDVTASFVDTEGTETVETSIFNTDVYAEIETLEMDGKAGYTEIGWSLSANTDAGIDALANTHIKLSEDTTYYGVYEKEVTLSYDTGEALVKIPSEEQICIYNASGNYKMAEFTIASAPVFALHSFVQWEERDTEGNQVSTFAPGVKVSRENDMYLVARFDRYPELEAYDRYFTLKEAQDGLITTQRLLEKVIGTDREDGILVNGSAVIVKDYSASVFLNMTENTDVNITYKAMDSFGNTVEKTVTIYVVDTTVSRSNQYYYVRFIKDEFFMDGDTFVAPEDGGVELTSIWRTNSSYTEALKTALSNEKTGIEYKMITSFGVNIPMEVAGSGTWEHTESTWTFTKEQIEEIKEFTDTYGYGNIKVSNALEKFFELFSSCRQE